MKSQQSRHKTFKFGRRVSMEFSGPEATKRGPRLTLALVIVFCWRAVIKRTRLTVSSRFQHRSTFHIDSQLHQHLWVTAGILTLRNWTWGTVGCHFEEEKLWLYGFWRLGRWCSILRINTSWTPETFCNMCWHTPFDLRQSRLVSMMGCFAWPAGFVFKFANMEISWLPRCSIRIGEMCPPVSIFTHAPAA